MIRPKKSKIIRWFFHHYIRHILKRNFHAFRYNNIPVDADKSVLLLANHFSWWDGFILYWLNHKLFRKRFHVMVLSETMQQVFFLKYMGAFSVTKHSREMLQSLEYAAQLLQNPENLVLIFPQGNLQSNFTDKIIFQQGLQRIIKGAAGKFRYVFATIFMENFQHKKPGIHIYMANIESHSQNVADLQQLYQQHYQTAKLHQTQIVV